jgi:hypothetical protein
MCKTCFIPTCGMMSSLLLMLLEPLKARVSCNCVITCAVVFLNPCRYAKSLKLKEEKDEDVIVHVDM